MCARYYGLRRGKRKTDKIIAELGIQEKEESECYDKET